MPARLQFENAFSVSQPVDLVNLHHYYAFFFRNDNLYNQIPDHLKNNDPYQVLCRFRDEGYPEPICKTDSYPGITKKSDIVRLVCAHYWARGTKFIVFDIGSHVGRFALEMASYFRYLERRVEVVAIDAGPAAALVPHNIAFNGLNGCIQFLHCAVCDVDGPLVFSFAEEHTDSGSLIREGFHAKSTLVPGISAASLISAYSEHEHFIVKLDLEGMEPTVIDQLSREHSDKCFTFITEFTPRRFVPDSAAVDFLGRIDEQYYVFNVGLFLYSPEVQLVRPAGFARLVEQTRNLQFGFIDLLLIPRKMAGADLLVSRLTQLTD